MLLMVYWFFMHVLQDNATFLHVPWWTSGGADPTIWESTSLLVADSLEQLRATAPLVTDVDLAEEAPADSLAAAGVSSSNTSSKVNYVLSCDNHTFVPYLTYAARKAVPVPVLVFVTSNVTLKKPPVPEEGIMINRPLYLIGLSSTPTSLDFHMVVNQLVMLSTYSNMTMSNLVLENLAPGDKRSAAVARPISVSVTANLWALLYDR
jgi:hypothetical protein